jgi:Putative MetA-pathway of phenol degradation
MSALGLSSLAASPFEMRKVRFHSDDCARLFRCRVFTRNQIPWPPNCHYLWSSTNNDPFVGFGVKSMQPGQAFHVNYATSYELFKNVRLGFNGYWLQQLTNHEINGVAVRNFKERTVGLGPGIQFGGQGIWFRVNTYIETDVRNRPSGIKVTFRISKGLAAKELKPSADMTLSGD